MLHLCYSNRFEALFAPLAVRIASQQNDSPLQPVKIIVPNPSVEQFMRFELSQRNGIAANLDIGLMRSFLTDLVESADPKVRVLDRSTLQLVIFDRLRDPSFINRHRLEAINQYLQHVSTPEELDQRVYQLSGELARLYDEYGFSRRDMLTAWRRGRCSTGR